MVVLDRLDGYFTSLPIFLHVVSVLRSVSILGSTGSVGKNTLEVLTSLSERFRLYGISCNQNILLLNDQITKYQPVIAVITDEKNILNL